MRIDINGKRNISLDFNAPRKFRLTKDGAEIPYIRTGKNSFRLSKNIDGVIDLEEIIEQPRYMQPVQLQPQQMTVINPQDVERLNEAVRQMALVNPNDIMIINQTAEQLEKNQNFIAQTQKDITDNQVYIDQQQQRLNESVLGIQALETDNSQRLDNAETSIYGLASDLDIVKNATIENTYALDSIREQELITQASLETKADKTDVDKIKEELNEYKDDNESFKNALSNYSGGLAVEYSVSEGGKDGQILTKITNETGVYGWKDPTPVIVKAKKMPNPSEKLKGEVYQYVGETGTYTHGFIYECQKVGNTYQWVRIDVQPNTAVWGQITGTLIDQTDLQTALNGKQDKLSTTQMEAVNSGANTSNILQITTNQNNITTINGLIPAQATTVNQLADKDFVNSSIATNTANFIGTFSSISDLEAYSGTVTNNDYAFVINREVKDNGNDWATFADLDLYDKSLLVNYDYAWVINGSKFDLYRFDYVNQTWDLRATNIHKADVTLNTAYNRYKAVVSGSITWTFEYTLNNSSFTASQWSAINSGITSGLVAEFEAKGASLDYASDILTLKDSSGNSLSSVTIQSSPDLDGKSITKNSSQELQTVGVINSRDSSTAIKTWTGTKAQYDDIVTKNANTEYFCTDNGELYLGDVKIGSGAGGLEIGDVGIAPFGIDETENKRRYLNGQVISQAQFVTFTNKLKAVVATYPNLATSEVNWQAAVTNSDLGQCGQFVIDDVAGTIRLPKVVNINGLQNLTVLGGIKAESLPNITGTAIGNRTPFNWNGSDGVFSSGADKTVPSGNYKANYDSSQNGKTSQLEFDASRSSSTYQDDAPVQQEAVQYPYFIQVAEGVETSIDVSREIELNNPFSLLDYKFSEYELDNASWLISNGQYNSGATYPAVYELLLQIYNGTVTKAGVSVKLSTETYTDTDFVLNTGDTTFRLPLYTQRVLVKKYVNGTEWYNLYSDGWCEQGFCYSPPSSSAQTINLLKEYKDTNYTVQTTYNTGSEWGFPLYVYNKTVNNFTLTTRSTWNTSSVIAISVCGYANIPTSSDFTEIDGLYFYVGETIQDANIIAAAGVLTDVANLKNASNFSSLGKETVVGWGIPDYNSGVSVSFPLSNSKYTAPSKGFYFAMGFISSNYSQAVVNGVTIPAGFWGRTSSNVDGSSVSILLDKGDELYFTNNLVQVIGSSFYPLKGVENV